jgi:hypothetical protein
VLPRDLPGEKFSDRVRCRLLFGITNDFWWDFSGEVAADDGMPNQGEVVEIGGKQSW